MMFFGIRTALLLALATLLAAPPRSLANIVINEIMYHPLSESTDEEFIELLNTGATTVDVSGWQFTSGVEFTIPPDTSIPAGGFLVVAADSAIFSAKHPDVAPVLGDWAGILSNSSNRVRLRDNLGTEIDEVRYADDGDWAIRTKDADLDYGHRGWSWDSDADGLGSSLELINPDLDNSNGQNWAASTTAEGTPGAANSTASGNIAPLILDPGHFPLVPSSGDPVQITARIVDDHDDLADATLHYRVDGDPQFTAVAMNDDGLHGDSLPADGVFGAILPIQADGTIIEFYFRAVDSAAGARTWPAEAVDEAGTPGQTANCFYQVDDAPHLVSAPLYRLVMTAADRTELNQINTNSPQISGIDQTRSHAQFNATFISQSGTGDALRYRCNLRNRGEGSRRRQPQSFRVNFLEQQPWEGAVGINLNTQQTPHQLLGSAVFRKAGLTIAYSRAVGVRANGVELASSGSPSYGFYVANEVINSDFADKHYPLDSGGNIYRVKQVFYDGSSPGGDLSDWSDDPDPALADPAPYRLHYFKRSNASEDDYSDLIRLTQKLAKGQSPSLNNPTWDPDYADEVAAVADVTQWMRFFAANTIADNDETNLSNGRGDDYSIYTGVNDPRATLIPYDLDSIFGSSSGSSTTNSIWRMCQNDILSGDPPGPLNPFMKHPEFAPVYFAELTRMLDGIFKPSNFDELTDEVIGGLVDATTVSAIKGFNASRGAWVRAQIPTQLAVTTAPATQNGYPRTTDPTITLAGTANAITTRSVTVNGTPAAWTAWTASWSAADLPLIPGLNRIVIRSFDADGSETESLGYDLWYDNGTTQLVSGLLATDTTWTAAGGPYELSSTLTIPSGVTLTIEPGTSVYLAAAADLAVDSGGRILAEGTADALIRFARPPGSATAWGSLEVAGGSGTPQSRIAHALIDGNGSPAIDINGADVILDHLEFGNTTAQYLSLDAASFVVSHCHFPDATTGFVAIHGDQGIKADGRGIIRNCFVGRVAGDNDAINFTGNKRPAPILQLINNVFAGSGDDLLNLDGTDAWVEGNIFLHTHKNGATDSASAVSGGAQNALSSNITIIGNIFYDVDHALTAREGSFFTFINNTVVRQTIAGGGDVDGGVINMRDPIPAPPTDWGAGCFAAGNIIADAEKLIRDHDPAETTVTLDQNLLPFDWSGAGSGNLTTDPLFAYVPDLGETNFTDWQGAQVMRTWFALLPGSQARGSGPGGRDMGGVIPLGAHLSGAPEGTTNLDSATLAISPQFADGVPWTSGFTHYVWRLDGGEWSTETPAATPISLAGLAPGDHYVELSGRNDGGLWQDDPDLGDSASVTTSATWTVDPGYTPPAPAPLVRINEVLARNSETLEVGGVFPDLIELHNAGTAAAGLEGWGLTDNSALPYKFTFPAGTTLAAGAYLLVHASSDPAVPAPKTGFALKTEGDTLTLTRSAAAGGGVADSIPFGRQLADYSIGRRTTDGAWDLCFPSFESANLVAPRSPASVLVINEWLASPGALFATDFIEIFNPSTLPVNIGLGHLTDNPTEWPDRHQLRQLTFIPAGNFTVFKADGDPQDGPDHLNFGLSSSQGEIGLFDASLNEIDCVLYGPQTTGVSEGRSPNGTGAITAFPQPTPGSPNPYHNTATEVVTIELIPTDAEWRYESSGTDLQGLFHDPLYDDSSWPSGGQLLFIENSSLSSASGFAKTTSLPGNPDNSDKPYRTSYFRHRFNYDGPLTDVTLRATMMIDDGAIIYINGQEAARVRMNAGPAAYIDFANATVDNASEETISIPAEHLAAGENLIAIEVHQVNASSSDIVLGMKLDAEVSTTVVTTENLIPADAAWKYDATGSDLSGVFDDPAFDDSSWPPSGQLLYIEDSSLPSPSGFVKTTALPGNPANSDRPYRTCYFRRHFTYDGSFGDLTLRATLMLDDGAVIYLNGEEAARVRMDAGAVGYDTLANTNVSNATEETLTIPHTFLAPGDNVIAVEVHQISTDSSDLVFGMKLDALTNTTPANLQVVINEVLVRNASLPNPDSSVTAWIELHNPAGQVADIGDMSLSDSFGDPRRWVFPPGATIPAGSSLVVHCDPLSPSSADNTALSLDPDGDSVILFDAPAIGGGLRDSVSFGRQLPDLSIGRAPNATGAFSLNLPTRNALNQAATLAPATSLHINEWLASNSLGDDFFEVYNTATQPVLLGGHYLTDDLGDRTRHPVPPLTFIAGSGTERWFQFIADGDGSKNGHVNFSLKAGGEEIGIFTAGGVQIDAVAFGQQTADVSEGSFPDGAPAINLMPPTPGAANAEFETDSDGDGMPDDWETANGLTVGIDDSADDPDGDGQSNLAEFIAGTDPLDPNSRLSASITTAGSGRPTLRFEAVAGRSYSIMWSGNLDGDWNKLTDIAPQPADVPIEVTDTGAGADPSRFYQVVTPARP